MIRELLDHKADMAIADLTITSQRQAAVDFTLPFMNLGISILFRKPEEAPPDLFSFLKPFSVEVWLYMATAFLGVSLLLYIISRLSPYEWVSSHCVCYEPRSSRRVDPCKEHCSDPAAARFSFSRHVVISHCIRHCSTCPCSSFVCRYRAIRVTTIPTSLKISSRLATAFGSRWAV